MKQALIGWKLTVKKIGKGTGKNAPMYRAQARELMAKCQAAVPGWIMPISRALESLDPRKNQFDIVIIDEASQSDISSLAILYMGKKLVIVGDDKQVSPMAVGMEVDKMNVLKDIYLKDKIPNAHLYDAKTSIYDIAATTFQPLMLREHFRCVPEIIGFSNWLSYDFKIKPLRDDSNSVLLPAVVNYHVENGQRVSKTNPNEAKTIVALMRACMEQPEYAGKTFGIISLLGDEQVKLIQSEVYQNIDAKVCAERQILCGNASNFQGDERDVIFLSVVDSGNGQGPLAMQGYGPDDAYRKRYNVAASRAKDQLWIVDSLDPATDLKPGDIRKQLIDYSVNPDSIAVMNEKIEQQAESPFEVSVAQYLAARGYHLVQQWKVGAYRLDMVAVCGKKTVAIECDGERYHSGESKIREDMERQTILERLGWRFIRIRGSEYYRDPDTAMKRVLEELTAFGIEPEESGATVTETRSTELLQRIKIRAHAILAGEQDGGAIDTETIAVALNPGTNGIGGHAPTEEPKKLSVPPVEKAKRAKVAADAADFNKPVAVSHKNTHYSKATSTPRQKVPPAQGEQMKWRVTHTTLLILLIF
jgi:very-short-patch-repair endonuclease